MSDLQLTQHEILTMLRATFTTDATGAAFDRILGDCAERLQAAGAERAVSIAGPDVCPTCGAAAQPLCTACGHRRDTCDHGANFRWRAAAHAGAEPSEAAIDAVFEKLVGKVDPQGYLNEDQRAQLAFENREAIVRALMLAYAVDFGASAPQSPSTESKIIDLMAALKESLARRESPESSDAAHVEPPDHSIEMRALEIAIAHAVEHYELREEQGRSYDEIAHLLTPLLWNQGVRRSGHDAVATKQAWLFGAVAPAGAPTGQTATYPRPQPMPDAEMPDREWTDYEWVLNQWYLANLHCEMLEERLAASGAASPAAAPREEP